MDNILAMISLDIKTEPEISRELAARIKQRRKERGLTQAALAQKAGVSLASYKRFEQKGLISLQSLIAISLALNCESDFDSLFSRKTYASIDEVIALSNASQKRR